MYKCLSFLMISTLVLIGCPNTPSTKELDQDIAKLEAEIKESKSVLDDYSGGLIAVLSRVRLQVLQSTKAMLEQKKMGFRRYIHITYTIDGKKYFPPKNKDKLLKEIKQDINNLKSELEEAKEESKRYEGGLLSVLSLTHIATIKNSIAFLEQKQLLLKYDIPYYAILPVNSKNEELVFKPTPGKDIDKF